MPYSTPLALLALSAVGASGSSPSVDLGAARAADITVAVRTLASGSVTVTLETSVDGAAWTSAVVTVGLGSVTAAPKVSTTKLTSLARYLRASWALSAATGLTMSIAGAAKVVYATPADQLMLGLPATAYGKLDDFANIQARALEAATDEADSAIRMQGTLPLSAWSDDLTAKVCAIADLLILRRRGFNPEAGTNDQAVAAARDARDWLKRLAAGDVDAGLVDSTPEVAEGGAIVTTRPRRGWDCL